MSGLRLLAFLALCWQGLAQDPGLAALRSSLSTVRGKPPGRDRLRGATPELTVAKHQLRDWVESRLPSLTPRGDGKEFQQMLNSELRGAGLLCCGATAPDAATGPDFSYSGFVGELKLRRLAGFLILQTAFGIQCGYDESAYVYSWSAEGWRRVWQTEQNQYTENDYKPQTLHAVLVSPRSETNDYLVLTLGSASWCSSGWHSVYYRAFRLGPDLEAGPLVEGEELAFFANDPPIQGSVAPDDVLVEFTVHSIDAGIHSRPAVRHYRIDRDQVSRSDPLALRPRDFVDEWLTHDWKEAAFWSESQNRRSMAEWHGKLHKDHVSGEFLYPPMHCRATPDLWQVGVDFSNPPTPIGSEPKAALFFLVRWRPPYIFRMVQVSYIPSAACTEEDREADEAPRTLFPVQEWR